MTVVLFMKARKANLPRSPQLSKRHIQTPQEMQELKISSPQKLPLDVLFQISNYLSPQGQLDFGLASLDLYAMIDPCVWKRILFDPNKTRAQAPLIHAVKTGNVPMLHMIHRLTDRTGRTIVKDWGEPAMPQLDLFELAARRSSASFKFLLEVIPLEGLMDDRLDTLGGAQFWLLAAAVRADKVSCVQLLLDHEVFVEAFDAETFGLLTIHCVKSAAMLRLLLNRGCTPSPGDIHRLARYVEDPSHADTIVTLVKDGLDVDNIRRWDFKTSLEAYDEHHPLTVNTQLSLGANPSGWREIAALVRGGLDIDSLRPGNYTTPLLEACDAANPLTIETLLRLGANPNGVGEIAGIITLKNNLKGKRALTRPIDVLLRSKAWAKRRCVTSGRMLRCFKALIDHGASTAPARFAGDPILALLKKIWRQLCPMARRAAGVGSRGLVTIDVLLEALPTVDIRSFGELCDVVVDANPTYCARAEGCRGQERLIQLLRQRKEPVRFRWHGYENAELALP
ncbi:hypothetical protein F5B20DRAFT_546763 [Whalleya microplaca]|nr:hypothetical protein F5B20DRAFT_546763 [Whalleya microplaca]